MLGRTRAIHCVGVGGSGMSGIAEVLLRHGFRVSGSDEQPSRVTERLASLGLEFSAGHAAAHVGAVDVVVISSAVRSTNAEVVEARRRGIPVIARAEMLAELMRVRFAIAVAGAHGKTTTTSMVAVMLEHAGLDPTAIVGGRLPAFGSNARVGRSEYLVVEADESDRSFLRLPASLAVVTNIDREHLESYEGFDDLERAFVTFASRVPFYGSAVLCMDDPHVRRVAPQVTSRVVTCAVEWQDAHLGARGLSETTGGSRATAIRRSPAGAVEALGELVVTVPGRHNVRNALAAAAVGLELGLPWSAVASGLAAFQGVERRFEVKGEAGGVRVVDDYGHHPTEVEAVLGAARSGHRGRVIVAFQPHRFSRTARLRTEFAGALARADAIVLTDIYAAGEDPIAGVTIEWLAEAIEAAAPGRVQLVRRLEDVPATVAALAAPGDLVLTLGAGSIGECGPRILEELGRWR